MPDKKAIFVAFAIEDVRIRDLIKGQSLNTSSPFECDDGFPLAEIMHFAATSPARNKVIILDSCFSGSLGDNPINRQVSEISEGNPHRIHERSVRRGRERKRPIYRPFPRRSWRGSCKLTRGNYPR